MANDENDVNQLIFDFDETLLTNSLTDSSSASLSVKDCESTLLYHHDDDDSELSEEDEDDEQQWRLDNIGSISGELSSSHNAATNSFNQKVSIVDSLLCEIYNKKVGQGDDLNGRDSLLASHSDHVRVGRTTSFLGDAKLTEEILKTKGIQVLQATVKELQARTTQISSRLIKELKRRDRRKTRLNLNCDLLTAIIQACSLKRRK
ncbi:TBC1 domain family member 30 [Trichoplax sp. H2]|uniref:Uncharacterized protein n=1 Tax=Trichoplax adhaerens TaxID=10228 RepID=B3RUG4_TRIAD|nr:hypothetical protein TRIADDRAFT_55279 [Trichoplax adhaerens]EDV25327.1 hypothetical protein TRIADDRAFT_55279 [Trichoplax adhaerens]RDD46041.1 TBC1 domain family member 30 [Trichoplax sp. H2]|eukprot:XP_002111360.1 hypothetical protein TRIADDRAFT_55279 [Trichoplax adhaerens]